MVHIDRIDPGPVHAIPYEFPELGGSVAAWCFPAYRAFASGIQPSLPVGAAPSGEGAYCLDGDSIDVDGIRVGAVAGVIGNPSKSFRREESPASKLIARCFTRIRVGPCQHALVIGHSVIC